MKKIPHYQTVPKSNRKIVDKDKTGTPKDKYNIDNILFARTHLQ